MDGFAIFYHRNLLDCLYLHLAVVPDIVCIGVTVCKRTTISFVFVLDKIVEKLVEVQQIVVLTVVCAIVGAHGVLTEEIVDRLNGGKTLGTNRLVAPESGRVIANLDAAQTDQILVALESLHHTPLAIENNHTLDLSKFIIGNLIQEHGIITWKQLK